MKPSVSRSFFSRQIFPVAIVTLCVALFAPGKQAVAQTPSPSEKTATTESDAPKIPNDQLDSLVAPIALYPDPMLAQTLAASTYPLEIIQLKQWMDKNKNVKGKALADAVAKQPWDPSIQSMVAIPEVVERLATNIQWTADLGNAFLAQQQDVLDAVQRMRTKAQSKGTLKTSKEQVVQTKTAENNKEVIVIEQANPETVYVPSYDPAIVYGPPAYPYYPYSYPGYYPGMGLAFGTGILIGAGIANNWWGNCNWGGGDININNNNNFNRNSNRNTVNNRPGGGNNKWQHNSNHRGPAPYSNRKTADKFGGNDRGGPNSNRGPGGDRNKPSQQPNNRPGGDRSSANKPGGDRSSANRPGGDRSSANRPTTRPSTPRTSGGDRVSPSRSVSHSPSSRSSSAFGSGGGYSRSSASSSFSRGSGSMGGGSRGGGSRGGGSRGGGRRR